MATATPTNETIEIRRRMAQIRRELHEDVQGAIQSAESTLEWRNYVRSYPWLSVGLAAALGYFIVPKRRVAQLSAPQLQETVDKIVESRAPEKVKEKKARSGLIKMGLGMLMPIAVRAVQSYAVQAMEAWLAKQQMLQMGAGGLVDPAAAGSKTPPRPGPAGPFGRSV